MLEEASELRAGEAGAKGFFKGSLFGMVGVSLMAVLWVGGSHVGDGSMTVSIDASCRSCWWALSLLDITSTTSVLEYRAALCIFLVGRTFPLYGRGVVL